ncbi:nudix hydrolase 2-like [Cynara cardunculus var. scolymus]|uniref:Nudix hydrolase 6-like protein n=1 Tax=Cynara cardunculus var. scolymus TaxID=59895 RepID=A0A103YK83_CYNCS|nr:nudix hydrolase 2-like [Cynara cardunculus var. scolymus]KVI10602.1 Nudix hydrolase 6-like protein [Cynara cardunculus var. scolymus]
MYRFVFKKIRTNCIDGGRKILQSSICTTNFNPICGDFRPGAAEGLRDKARSAFQTRYRSSTNMVTNMEHSSKVSENEVDHVDMLNASYDAYEGVTVNIKNNMDENVFTTLLQTSISQWRQQGKKGVWLKLSLELVNLVKPAVKEGFWYHHAEPTYLMLVYWIPETNCTLPYNASHRVGVAAFALNSKGEVLVVQEKTGRFKGKGIWKLPTGVVEEGEDICTAAIREVKEETGIDTEFVEVLAFRQCHKSFFSKSDLMFVCMLKPTSHDIEKQDSEIEAAQWMPVEEYANQPFVKKHESFDRIAKICMGKKDDKFVGFTALPTSTATSAKKSYLYSNYQEHLSDS